MIVRFPEWVIVDEVVYSEDAVNVVVSLASVKEENSVEAVEAVGDGGTGMTRTFAGVVTSRNITSSGTDRGCPEGISTCTGNVEMMDRCPNGVSAFASK